MDRSLLHQIPRAGLPTLSLLLVATIVARPRAVEPGAPGVASDAIDHPVKTERITMREAPAPQRCLPVSAIRVLRGHVETSLDRRLVVHDGEPLVAEPSDSTPLRLEPGASFAIRFQSGGLDTLHHSLSRSQLRFATALPPAELCIGDVWLSHEEAAAPHSTLYVDAIVDAVE